MQNSQNQKTLKRQGMRKGIALLPNLITTGNLFCGFLAMINAYRGNFQMACYLIILAGFFDSMDGRVARMTNTQSDFGIEYDSLSDLTTFCIAPALLIYTWSLKVLGQMGIAAGFVYFACGALRLARFNVQAHSVERTDFQGLPSPAAAGTILSYIMFHTFFFEKSTDYIFFSLILTAGVGLLMVSNVRYPSFKAFKARGNFLYLIGFVAFLFVMASKPEITLFLFGICYISYGLVQWIWASPKKIKNLKDYLVSIYQETPLPKRRRNKKKAKKNNLKKSTEAASRTSAQNEISDLPLTSNSDLSSDKNNLLH